MGSLGTTVAGWLSEQHVQHIQLSGRTGKLSMDTAHALADTTHPLCHSEIAVHKADTSTTEEAGALAAAAPGHLSQLQGIMHASGVLADATFGNQSAASLRQAFGPKTCSAANLHHATHHSPLRFQVLFSSVTALLGGMGQANYAAANAALDSLAAAWQLQGQAGVSSVQWGGWAGGGMASADATTAGRLARMGMALIEPKQGLAALAGMLRSTAAAQPAQLTAVPFVWDKFLMSSASAQTAGIFDEFTASVQSHPLQLPNGPSADSAVLPGSAVQGASAAPSQGLTAAQRLDYLTREVAAAVANVLGSAVAPTEPLMAAGLDSLGAVELKNALETHMGLELPSTLIFDYPSVDSIAEYVNIIMPALAEQEPAAPVQQKSIPASIMTGTEQSGNCSRSTTVVTGIASRSVRNAIESIQSVDIIAPPPLERWDVDEQAGSAARFGGFLQDLDMFDGSLFGLSANEAELMDPQQRMLLETSHQVSSSPQNSLLGQQFCMNSHTKCVTVHCLGHSTTRTKSCHCFATFLPLHLKNLVFCLERLPQQPAVVTADTPKPLHNKMIQ